MARLRSSAANLRIPSRFIVRLVALALGKTLNPSRSRASNSFVAIASISGIIRSGFSVSTSALTAAGSNISITCALCATCIAGASEYRSTAIVSTPNLCSSIATSLPNSPLPRSMAFVAEEESAVPRCVNFLKDIPASYHVTSHRRFK